MTVTLLFPWSDEIEQRILELHSEGTALLDICSMDGMPTRAELSRHERQSATFQKQMHVARLQFQQFVFEECLQIADDSTGDYRRRVGRNGEEKEPELDIGSIQRSKLRIDTRLKALKIIDPVKYGGKPAGGGRGEAPRGTSGEPVKQLSPLELARGVAFMLEKGKRQAAAQVQPRVPPAVVNGSHAAVAVTDEDVL